MRGAKSEKLSTATYKYLMLLRYTHKTGVAGRYIRDSGKQINYAEPAYFEYNSVNADGIYGQGN